MDLGALFGSGRAAELVLGFMLLEGLGLFAWSRRRRARPAMAAREWLPNLLAGACLVLALRSALTDGPWLLTAGWVVASLPPHVFDLVRRARSAL